MMCLALPSLRRWRSCLIVAPRFLIWEEVSCSDMAGMWNLLDLVMIDVRYTREFPNGQGNRSAHPKGLAAMCIVE